MIKNILSLCHFLCYNVSKVYKKCSMKDYNHYRAMAEKIVTKNLNDNADFYKNIVENYYQRYFRDRNSIISYEIRNLIRDEIKQTDIPHKKANPPSEKEQSCIPSLQSILSTLNIKDEPVKDPRNQQNNNLSLAEKYTNSKQHGRDISL